MQLGVWSTRICTVLLAASSLLQAQAGANPGANPAARPGATPGAVEEAGARRVPDYGLPDVELFLRAGRPVPPGLTATRVREREADRAAALTQLAAAFAPDAPERERWVTSVSALLSSAAAGAEIWSTAASTVAELGLYELDRHLLVGLDAGAKPLVQHTAAEALRRLYGVRPVPGEPFVRPFEPSSGTRYLLDVLTAREKKDLAIRAALFETDPERALAALADPDPAVRAEGARISGAAVTAGRLEAVRVRDALLARLGSEVAARAFYAELEALLLVTVGLTPAAPEVAAVRSVLLRLAGEAPEAMLLSLAHGLARLPWQPGPDRPEANLRAAGRHLAKLLGRVAADPHADRDVTAGILRALEDLLALVESTMRAEGSTEDGAWVRGCEARAPLLALLASDRAVDSVRRAAAETLGRVALRDDLARILEVLEDQRSGAGLRYALLGTLGALAGAGGADVEPIVDTLFAHLDDADADLRRRALSLLSSPRLEPVLRGRDLSRLIARLEGETVRELRLDLLALLRRHGDRAMLEPLLAVSSFDALASGDPAHARTLAATLAELAKGDPEALLASARRLADVPDPGTGVARLVRCLDLVVSLSSDAAVALSEEDHDRIVSWARRVRSGGASFAESSSKPTDLLRRLVDVHLPGLGNGAVPSEAERRHMRAMFLGDLVGLGDASSEQATFDAYERALVLAEETGEVFLAARVRRDRARFALERGKSARALGDLRGLASNPEAAGVLELEDLRVLAGLIGASARPAGDTSLEVEAFGVLLTLVTRDAWRGEPGAVRLSDLQNLAGRALATSDGGRLERARAVRDLLAGVSNTGAEPDAPTAETTTPSPEPAPIWKGLDREPAWRADLLQLVTGLDAALSVPGAAPPLVEDEPAPTETPPDKTSARPHPGFPPTRG
jgi:hypothetical protein